MTNAVVIRISLKRGARADSLEAYFRKSVKKLQDEGRVSASVTFSLYAPTKAGRERIWITQFPDEELERVTRSAWPFVLLGIFTILKEVMARFAADVAIVASSVITAQELLDQWNERHGRFTELTLDEAPRST
jgi:hypothetical protein